MRVRLIAFAFVALLSAVTAAAKEPTRKLLIWGGRLAGSIELTDSATLALSDIYSGSFIDTSRAPLMLPADLPRYTIAFYLSDHRGVLARLTMQRPRLNRAYIVYFVPDAEHHVAYVYVPGHGDTWSAWNHGVIIRENREGVWSWASAAWGHRISDAIAQARRLRAPSCPVSDSNGRISPNDSVYTDVASLSGKLERNGIHVLCAYHPTFDALLGQRRSAGVMTSLGPLLLTVFPPPAGAMVVQITSSVKNGELVTVLHGPDPRRPTETISAADKTDFIIDGAWLIDSFGQTELRSRVAAALHR